MSKVTTLSLDYETRSEADLKKVGLHNYMIDPSTEATMVAWSFNRGSVQQCDFTDGEMLPSDVRDALLDPHVEKWGFNSAFERYATKKLLGIKTPVKGWRCSMVLAFMRSFSGGLEQVGAQLGLPANEVKDPIGTKLVRLFAMPQRVTKKQPYRWRDRNTDPYSWQEFLHYNRQDVVAEMKITDILIRFPVLASEWELFEVDQIINDRGLPVDIEFVRNGRDLAVRRKAELMQMMREAAQFSEEQNPGSNKQILPWLQERGYPFSDLQKATIKKVLAENVDGSEPGFLADAAVSVLKLRQQANRTSVKKLDAMLLRVDSRDNRLRHCFQFAGAQRTNRWSGRGPQPQNLVRTPKMFESRGKGDWSVLLAVTEAIRQGNYDLLHTLVDEPMGAIAGAMRSSFRAPEGYEFVVCDLSAIESAVIAWLADCTRLLNVFRQGKDPYKDFGTELYQKPYDLITKDERGICKPPTLGCGFGLGGGKLREGKKTGLWGYAEGMGVDITKEEAARQVDLFRKVYPEIPEFWKKLEDGCRAVVDRGKEIVVNDKLVLTMRSNFLTMQLPSERLMFYYKPRIIEKEFPKNDGGTYKKKTFTCMGKQQGTNKWTRINVGGPKMCLGPDTLVLTDRGWVEIVQVTLADMVWDGEGWVQHDGVVFNGVREVLSVDGVEMTPDHLVLTESGWDEAKNCGGQVRQSCGAWYEPSSGLSCVAKHEMPVPSSDAPCLEELRCKGHHGLSAMDGLREVLGGYGRRIPAWIRDRTRGQQQGVFTVELPMGHSQREQREQKDERAAGHALGQGDDGGSVKVIWDWEDDVELQAAARMRPVFDILNAGPNHQFVVAGEIGPFRVHNCENAVQATAREVLALGMRRAHNYGFKLVGSVHDELIALRRKGDNYFTLEALKECMIEPVPWLKGLPLGAAGYISELYKKD